VFIVILGREIVTTHRPGRFIVILWREILTTHGTRDVNCDSREGD
jgi:hypothetical protein